MSIDIRNPSGVARLDAINQHALARPGNASRRVERWRARISPRLEAADGGDPVDVTDLRAIIGGLEEVLGVDRLEACWSCALEA